MAPIGNTSWVCDPSWESYALEQAERLKSHDRAKKVVHTFAWNPLYSTIEDHSDSKVFFLSEICYELLSFVPGVN